MDRIDWQRTARGNVDVPNDTRDLYAYPDVTAFAEFLYTCVARTVEQDLPRELRELAACDQAKAAILARMDTADARVSLLMTLIRQNGGTFPCRRGWRLFQLYGGRGRDRQQIIQEGYTLPPRSVGRGRLMGVHIYRTLPGREDFWLLHVGKRDFLPLGRNQPYIALTAFHPPDR
jgi:hypothetical protein